MNIPNSNVPDHPPTVPGPVLNPPDVEALERAVRSLRAQFIALLVVLLVLSGSFNLFLLRQFKMVRAQVSELGQLVDEYEKKRAPYMNAFVNELRKFSKSYPDYIAVLTNYVPLTETNIPAPTPAPAPALPAKK
jgi:predicted PurR-regulated permease PerM